MEQRLTLITLGVDDLKRMQSFYCNVFNWNPIESSNKNITFFQLNGILLALYGRDALADDAVISPMGEGFRSFTLSHNLQSVVEVDRLFDELKASNADVIKSPEETEWGGYSGYIADPEGNLWEIAYNPFFKFDEFGNVIA